MLKRVEEHLDWILGRIGRTETADLPLAEARGLALAVDTPARHDLPMWDASAMDGYAVRAADTASADAGSSTTAIRLEIAGEVVAGSDADPPIPQGGAVRVMTGAPVPSDADAVIAVEFTESDRAGLSWAAEWVAPHAEVAVGTNVRRRGEDVRAGELVGRAGDTLSAARVSALAAAGVITVRAHRQPRIAVLTTGSELLRPGERLGRGRIPESNSLLVSGMVAEAGFESLTIEHCDDDAERLAARLTELGEGHDVIITTGGLGPGTHDVVRIALENEPEVRGVRVALRPGQLQRAGHHSGGAFMLCLPGNPVSVAVSFEMFVRPALLTLAGHAQPHRLRLSAAVAETWQGKVGPVKVLPVRIEQGAEGLTCAPAVAASRVSHSVATHGDCNGYAIVESERGVLHVGERVQVIQTGPL